MRTIFQQINLPHYAEEEEKNYSVPKSNLMQRDIEANLSDDKLADKFEICAQTLAEWLGLCICVKKNI